MVAGTLTAHVGERSGRGIAHGKPDLGAGVAAVIQMKPQHKFLRFCVIEYTGALADAVRVQVVSRLLDSREYKTAVFPVQQIAAFVAGEAHKIHAAVVRVGILVLTVPIKNAVVLQNAATVRLNTAPVGVKPKCSVFHRCSS